MGFFSLLTLLLSCPYLSLMKFLVSNESKHREVEECVLVFADFGAGGGRAQRSVFSMDPTPKTWRCGDELCPEMPRLLLQVVLNLGTQSPDINLGAVAVQRQKS